MPPAARALHQQRPKSRDSPQSRWEDKFFTYMRMRTGMEEVGLFSIFAEIEAAVYST